MYELFLHYLYSLIQMVKVANAILVMMVMMVVGILGQCKKPQQFIPDGKKQCQFVNCRNNNQCQGYAKFCNKNTEIKCLYYAEAGRQACVCRGQWVGDRYGNGGCNFHLNGNTKCGEGQVCSENNVYQQPKLRHSGW
jgi:hypothetical protein